MDMMNSLLILGICLLVSVQSHEGRVSELLQRIRRQTTICAALTCEHGHCEERSSSVICVCDQNYTGANCNIKCEKNCGTNLQIKPNEVRDGKGAGFITVARNVRMGTLDVLPNPFKTYGSYTSCGFGFRCYNDAECDHSISREGRLRFSCICKAGFIGDFCEVRCDKKCKNGGSCLVERKLGKMLCGCPWPFSGPDCGTVRYPFWHEMTSRKMVTGA
ncbi:protein crumbs homolog 1-like [Mizuhopecten yessoensis]|uniref:Adhesive plaque matrix protein 2 n=1 Tax=Mizuhopecten yessoensis TaxID=6573 RepID=A0A210PNT6_MIZYE|nr:protein crumbs homolog 1-like [Mizuhopecten yessoensis]OWF38169.1 Adhesive plaque matrix protein 2 [Mizuhopecten yessoensis]